MQNKRLFVESMKPKEYFQCSKERFIPRTQYKRPVFTPRVQQRRPVFIPRPVPVRKERFTQSPCPIQTQYQKKYPCTGAPYLSSSGDNKYFNMNEAYGVNN